MLRLKAQAELELRKRAAWGSHVIYDYERWLEEIFPQYFSVGLGQHHKEFWEWASNIEPNSIQDAFVAVWARGSGKSTNAEILPIYLWKRNIKSYCWYVSGTQAQADDHISNIGSILEGIKVERQVNKYGHSSGWRRNRLWAEGNLVIDALGLDTAKRGVKVEEKRPDLIIFDDIDMEVDTIETALKKENIIQTKLLPAGSKHTTIVFVQNLVIPHGVVSRLITGASSWLYNKQISGPIPAIEGLETKNIEGRDTIISGNPTWIGQDLEICQHFIDTWGLRAFLREAQHEVFDTDTQIFSPSFWDGKNRVNVDDPIQPAYHRIARYIFADTAFKDKLTSDPSCIGVFDLTSDYKIVVRYLLNKRIQSADIPNVIIDVAEKFGGEKDITGIIVEDKASGTTVIQTLKRSSPEWIARIIGGFLPEGSKEYRARNASVWCGRDCVLFPEMTSKTIEWMSPFADPTLGQLFRFPNAPNDDMVDTLVMAILYLEAYLAQGWNLRIGTLGKRKQTVPYDDRVRKALRKNRRN